MCPCMTQQYHMTRVMTCRHVSTQTHMYGAKRAAEVATPRMQRSLNLNSNALIAAHAHAAGCFQSDGRIKSLASIAVLNKQAGQGIYGCLYFSRHGLRVSCQRVHGA